MKALWVALMMLMYTGGVGASPTKKITDSCLTTDPISRDISYVDLSPSSFYVEADDVRNIESKTILHRNQSFGIWEKPDSSMFGLIAGGREVPVSEVIKLGEAAPSTFTPYTAQWGEVRDAKEAYLCITFNFEGLGQSGSFQNIRGMYLFDLTRRPAAIYYLVGDVRTLGK
jgi:hypothetical protein